MKVVITLEYGERITGDLYAVEVWDADRDAAMRAHVSEIASIAVIVNDETPGGEDR